MSASQHLFSIGEMSKLCKVSQKTLRYYDQIGLLKATIQDKENSYRYYDESAYSRFMAIKYYQATGLSLETIANFQKAADFSEYITLFNDCIREKEEELKKILIQRDSLKQWKILMEEGLRINNKDMTIQIVKMRTIHTLSVGTSAKGHQLTSPLSVRDKFEKTGQMVYGPAYLEVPSFKKLLNGEAQIIFRHMEIHPKAYQGIDSDKIGGFSAISLIHLGSLEHIGETYRKLIHSAEKMNLKLKGNAIERYIVDDCTTENERLFSVEIMLPIEE